MANLRALFYDPQKLSEVINQKKNSLGLFAYEGESNLDIKSYFQTHSVANISDIVLYVGSEGGFSKTEVQLFSEHGLSSVSLGDQILRVETACIALISVLKYQFELMR